MVGFVRFTILQSPRPWSHTSSKRLPTWDPGTHGLQTFCRICHWLATSGCRTLTISKLSAQLSQCAASRVLCALPNPENPNVKCMVAASWLCGCSVSVWSTLLREGEFPEPLSPRRNSLGWMRDTTATTTVLPASLGPVGSSVVLQHFLGQEVLNVVRVSHWCPQHFEALLGCGQSLVASPHHRLWIVHSRSCR